MKYVLKIMDSIIASLVPYVFTALAGLTPSIVTEANKLVRKYKLKPVLRVLPLILNVLDVLIGSRYPDYNQDQKMVIIREVIKSLADADLSDDDLKLATDYVREKFDPLKYNPTKLLSDKENEVVEQVSAKLVSL